MMGRTVATVLYVLALVAVGPVSIEYQAAVIGDELEESAGWTAAGIARVLTEKQARTIAATGG